ncbi:hypothetical protein PGIGA_G00137670 [Pangasianodon gigas]|uniref:Uncharacterized protein n=1 Tax=Pangasianodon gigas TaxID=30993 RepID=A0ACC5XK34_PANGG|nr:hypothetical protein [Pangasianodon gigas]
MSLVDLGKRLLEAARNGEDEEVRKLMANGAPFTTDWLGASPLHLAAQYGHRSTAEVLLRAGICKDARTKVDRTPLHMAATEGHELIVDLLIRVRLSTTSARVSLCREYDTKPSSNPTQVRYQTLVKPNAGNSEDAVAVSALDQQVMSDGGQRVVTIVTDQQGHLQTRLTQPLYVTMQNGRQVLAVPSGQFTQESVDEEAEPPVRRRKIEVVSANHIDTRDTFTQESVDEEAEPPVRRRKIEVVSANHIDTRDTEQLQRRLAEANMAAQLYRQQLLQKEQEAEEYRMQLEAITERVITQEGECVEEKQEDAEEEVVLLADGDVMLNTEEIDSTADIS